MSYKGLLLRFIGSFLVFFASSVFAYDEPTVNLGYTSFMDGGPPAGPGWYVQNYFQYYSSNLLADNVGNKLLLPNTALNATADIVQLIYLSTKKVLGANLGVSAVLPILLGINVDDGLHNTALTAKTGVTELFIGPALQYDPIMREDGKTPLFVQRFEFDAVAPVGYYSPKYTITPSTNFWSINPYWAATIWLTPKLTLAYRLNYLWNAVNHSPYISLGPTVYSTQAGQMVFGNVASEYAFTEQFHLGANGYFLCQINDTRFNGVYVPGRRERVWAIGPGMLAGLTKNQFVFLNLYIEQDARNRPQGTNVIFRYVIHLS